ncbi:hypothetical protein [Terrarubrum flagellatum]|uniref:hypothetical protein n=1 Tax=Terrirubrum flagellatum TaxID=2895980 RepID=UPI0031450654
MIPISSGWLFILVLVSPLVGLLLALGAIPFAIYSLRARNARRGLTTSRIALGLSLLSLIVSAVLWIEIISGQYLNGSSLNYSDPDFLIYEVVAALEGVALVLSVLGFIKRHTRR